jgi:hypothetical protein
MFIKRNYLFVPVLGSELKLSPSFPLLAIKVNQVKFPGGIFWLITPPAPRFQFPPSGMPRFPEKKMAAELTKSQNASS